MTAPLIRLGSRASPLAVAQSVFVQARLAEAAGEPIDRFPILTFTTTGDQIQDRRLLEAGGKGLFTKELDIALDEGRIDAAVHSMKDLPTQLPPGQILSCVPSREDPHDGFISLEADSLDRLKPGAVIGTASLRRQAQTLYLRPDLKVEMLRGSVETRLKRIAEGAFAATYLARAGLNRLGLERHARSIVPLEVMPPAAGQGALAITSREAGSAVNALLAKITLPAYEIATTAERSFLEALDGSCRTPIAAHAAIDGDSLTFLGEALTPNGSERWRRQATIELGSNPHKAARALGLKLGGEIKAEAGGRIMMDLG